MASPCGGCGGGAARSTLARAQASSSSPSAVRQPPPMVMVIVTGVGTERQAFIGKQTGRNYGRARNGDVLWLDMVDYENERRVVKATQDTLRMAF